MSFNLHLRDYQVKAVTDIRSAYRSGAQCPLLVMPTGSGKTVVFSYITYHVAQTGKKIFVIVHRRELLRQASKQLTDIGVKHGFITAGSPMSRHNVQVCTIQTLAKRMEKIDIYPDLIICDEFHHSTSSTWKKVLGYFNRARILGCTATPERLDGSGLGDNHGGFADRMILGPSVRELVQQGWISKPVIYCPPAGIDLKGIRKSMGDYAKNELEERIDRPKIIGNVIEHYKKICPGRRAMAFCVSVKHAEEVAKEFNFAGIPAASIDGKMSDRVREERLNGLKDKKYLVLTSCELVNEGIDIPAVSVAVFLRPTMSLGLYLQQTGRCLRIFPGKKETIVLDHVGNVHRHGHPVLDREWSLGGMKKRRKKDVQKGFNFRTCQKCWAAFPVHKTVCPQCGTQYTLTPREIEVSAGELKKYEEIQRKRNNRAEVWKSKTLDSLIKLGKSRGYKYPLQWAEKIIEHREKKRNERV